MTAYYNEIDPFAAAWLRELIKEKLIADGEVDERSIELVQPGDLRGFTQCHFFAGIGGWSYALRLAGWPDTRRAWTGSCPCQPFSVAGKGEGANDARHLWPAWFPLIRECRPPAVFGEQTASTDGRWWLDVVLADLEGIDYAIGAFDLPAAGVGAPHCRQRLWFVADALGDGGTAGTASQVRAGGVSDCHGHDPAPERRRHELQPRLGGAIDLSDADVRRRRQLDVTAVAKDPRQLTAAGFHWRTEPEPEPVAYGIPDRVGRIRGYGNAIVPQVAQVFIESYLDCER